MWSLLLFAVLALLVHDIARSQSEVLLRAKSILAIVLAIMLLAR